MRRFVQLMLCALIILPPTGSDAPDTWDAHVCGSGWAEYGVLHREMIAGKRPGKYVTFKPDPWRGYANQLLGISSAFATALLTKRALLIQDDELAVHFFSPFISWYSGLVDTGEEEMLYDAIKDCDAHDLWTSLSRIDLEDLFPSHAHNVSISTNILWPSQLFSNPRYRDEVASWGLASRDSFFSCSMSYLLRPTIRLRRALAPLLQSIRGKYSIGIQLRLNPETAQVRLADVAAFIQCGQHLARSRGIAAQDIRWVVATDTPDALLHVIEAVGSDGASLVWWDAPQDDGTGRRASDLDDPAHNASEVLRWATKKSVDHYMLSQCNHTIISFASTFGLTAAEFEPAPPRSLSETRNPKPDTLTLNQSRVGASSCEVLCLGLSASTHAQLFLPHPSHAPCLPPTAPKKRRISAFCTSHRICACWLWWPGHPRHSVFGRR
jgi:hypothetical protein